MAELTITVRARTRGMWAIRFGTFFLWIATWFFERCGAEAQIGNGKWQKVAVAEVTKLHIQIVDFNKRD